MDLNSTSYSYSKYKIKNHIIKCPVGGSYNIITYTKKLLSIALKDNIARTSKNIL